MPSQLLTPEGLLTLAVVIVIFSGLVYFFRFEVSEFELGIPPKVKFTRRRPAATKPSLTTPNMPGVNIVRGDQIDRIMVRELNLGTTDPIPATKRPALEEPKVYLPENSPEEVVAYIASLKPLQRDSVAAQTYIGRWVRWSGEILNIRSYSSFLEGGAFTVMVGDHVYGHAHASLVFLSDERHLVEPLQEGDLISYEAKIIRAFSSEVYLTDVTFMRTEEPSILDVTPEYLMGFFEGHTDMQGRTRAAEYIGKWMKASGRVENISSGSQVTFADRSPVHAVFRKKKWLDHLLILGPGDNITIRTQIVKIQPGNLVLDSCEFIGP